MIKRRWRRRPSVLNVQAISHSILASAQLGLNNRTIDDQDGDSITGLPPTYSPATGWAQGSNCVGCQATIPTDQLGFVVDGTWHDTTHHPSDAAPRDVTIQFNGIALYVYCILANSNVFSSNTYLQFFIDGDVVGNYAHVSDNSSVFQPNVSVYSNVSIPDGTHQFILRSGGPNVSLVLFDYVVYTVNSSQSMTSGLPSTTSSSKTSSPRTSSPKTSSSKTSSPKTSSSKTSSSKTSSPKTSSPSLSAVATSSPSHSAGAIQASSAHTPNVGAIAGGSIGGIALVGLMVVAYTFLHCRRRRRRRIGDADSMKEGGHPTLNQGHIVFPDPASRYAAGAASYESYPSESGAASVSVSLPASSYPDFRGAAIVLPDGADDISEVRTEAARRQGELSRQIRDKERVMTGLQRGYRRPPGAQSGGSSPSSSVTLANTGDMDAGREIQTLRQELAQLRLQVAQYEIRDSLPPDYTA